MPSKYCVGDSKGDTKFPVIRSWHQIEVLKSILAVVLNLLEVEIELDSGSLKQSNIPVFGPSRRVLFNGGNIVFLHTEAKVHSGNFKIP